MAKAAVAIQRLLAIDGICRGRMDNKAVGYQILSPSAK